MNNRALQLAEFRDAVDMGLVNDTPEEWHAWKRNQKTKLDLMNQYTKHDDDKIISQEEWDDYEKRLKEWNKRKYDSDMDKGMSKPNPPNYFRANND